AEKAMYTLLYRKDVRHKEICSKNDTEENFIEHEELHKLIPLLKRLVFDSIDKRFPEKPGTCIELSSGGKIFALNEEAKSMPNFLKNLFGKDVDIHLVSVKMA